MEISGRRIKIVTGKNTQTINVYSDNDTERVYSHRIRISAPAPFVTQEKLAQQQLATIDNLVAHLEQHHGGVLEVSIPDPVPPRLSNVAKVGVSPAWCDTMVSCVEQAINTLVTEFVKNPYVHRVEHSIHCHLFMELHKCPGLNGFLPIGNQNVGYVHKEYPETKPRPDKRGRRGNFDMAVLGPLDDPAVDVTILDFLTGRIAPGFVMEVGLDYGPQHLRSDWEKLKHSQVKRGYLLHLARVTGNPQTDIENLCQQIMADEANQGPKLAVCVLTRDRRYQRLLGQNLQSYPI